MKFTSFNNWKLMETKKVKEQSKKTEYGCIMLYTTVPNWDKHIDKIEKDDIYDDKFKDYGLEHTPHVTVLFGIHLDETKPEDVKKVLKLFKPVIAYIDTIGTFENKDFDVVKYNVPVTPLLKLYREAVMAAFPNTQTFPDYHPHMTIAYVLPEKGKKYKGGVKPFKVTFDTAVYSYAGKNGERERIKVKLKND